MKTSQRYALLCPGALAFAFGVLALFAALAMGTPATFGMSSMMWGAHDAVHYGPIGVEAFGLVTIVRRASRPDKRHRPRAHCFTLRATVTSPLPSRCSLAQSVLCSLFYVSGSTRSVSD
jgi:hypothetical protein